MNGASQLIVNNAIELAFTVIAAVATGVVIPQISRYFKAKTQNAKIHMVMDELEKTAVSSVNYIEQQMVKDLKAEGRWDIDSQKEVLDAAINTMIRGLSNKTCEILEEEKVHIGELAARYIESAIVKSKE